MSSNIKVVSINEQKIVKQTIIVTIVLSVLFSAVNYYLHPDLSFSIIRFILGIIIYLILSLLLVVANEILIILGYRKRCKVARTSLSISIHLEKGLIYSKTSEKIKNGHYQSVFLTSFSMTGIIPLAFGFALDSYPILLASASFIAGSLGNFLTINKLRKFPDDCLVQDVPEKFSVLVYLDETLQSSASKK
ncbi:MAG TPA: metalloprotease family protein [Ureibacillus sp.]|nr:metalloprotease family protein [Ureibacillus sp.]